MRSIVLEVSSGQNVFQRSRIPIRVTNGASTKVRVAPNFVPLYMEKESKNLYISLFEERKN